MPTETDLKTAVELLAAIHADSLWISRDRNMPLVDRIAQALADERAKALGAL